MLILIVSAIYFHWLASFGATSIIHVIICKRWSFLFWSSVYREKLFGEGTFIWE